MKEYNFDELIERKGTNSVKWDRSFNSKHEHILPLWVADMDFACADEILEALHTCVDRKVFGYDLGFDDTYRAAVCDWFSKRLHWDINPSSIFYAGGVVPAIAYSIEMLSKEGDGVIIQTPVYYPFAMKIEAAKRKVIENPLVLNDGYYTMDFVDLEAKLARVDVAGMILCSPHNPVGRVWKVEELKRIVALAKRYKKWIISDEIHCDLIRSQHQHTPIMTLADDYADEIIVCTAPSKSFNLAGLQISNIIIANVHYQKKWKQYVQGRLSIMTPNSFAISACIAAYSSSEDWLDQVNTYIDHNLTFAMDYLAAHLPRAIVSPCEGTYLLWVDVRAYCEDAAALEKRMLQEGLILDEGYLFGDAGKGFERINVACSMSILRECLERFVTALQ